MYNVKYDFNIINQEQIDMADHVYRLTTLWASAQLGPIYQLDAVVACSVSLAALARVRDPILIN